MLGRCAGRSKVAIEDPLAEELLKGEFQGKDTIRVDVVKDDEGKVLRLDFKGEFEGRGSEPHAVAAGGHEASSEGQQG